jgi:hypothetical protein
MNIFAPRPQLVPSATVDLPGWGNGASGAPIDPDYSAAVTTIRDALANESVNISAVTDRFLFQLGTFHSDF